MPKYTGQLCQSCKSTFADGDDIVVCPECGSPYHRECYIKEGSCVSASLHESGESWAPEALLDEAKASEADEKKTVGCRNCGTENDAESPFCQNCGAPVNMEKAAGSFYERMNSEHESEDPFAGGFPFAGFVPLRRDQVVDGDITVEEYAKYIGKSKLYYIPKFQWFSKGKKASFNLSAFLFPQFYFFYRKMILPGILIMLASVILSAPGLLYIMEGYGLISSLPVMEATWFENLTSVFNLLSYILNIAVGFFANYIYYKNARTDVAKIKIEILEPQSRINELERKGGTSWSYVLAAFMATSILTYGIAIASVLLLK